MAAAVAARERMEKSMLRFEESEWFGFVGSKGVQ